MYATVAVNPELIRWAVKRSGLPQDELAKFPVEKWETGEKQPTVRQLESFAKRTMTPFGYLFLSTPPEEKLPMPDFRTVGDTPIHRPSPNLIDTIQTMQRRQMWMRDELIEQGQSELPFIGSLDFNVPVETAAKRIKETLKLSEDWASSCDTWASALRLLRNTEEKAGIMVAVNSVVGFNNHRPLDPDEFRGFVLCDTYAPLVFVNGADTKSAQMFTMAHELAHLWMGYSGLFNLIHMQPNKDEKEIYCNRVAAEFLIPGKKLTTRWKEACDSENPYDTIARWFKVSPLVAARRALDMKLIDLSAFFAFYNRQQQEWQQQKDINRKRDRKGDFYKTTNVRLGIRFAYAVICAAREGRLPYRDAYQLIGLKGSTFDSYANRLMERVRNG